MLVRLSLLVASATAMQSTLTACHAASATIIRGSVRAMARTLEQPAYDETAFLNKVALGKEICKKAKKDASNPNLPGVVRAPAGSPWARGASPCPDLVSKHHDENLDETNYRLSDMRGSMTTRAPKAEAASVESWYDAGQRLGGWPMLGGVNKWHASAGPWPKPEPREWVDFKPKSTVSSWYDAGVRLSPAVASWYDSGLRLKAEEPPAPAVESWYDAGVRLKAEEPPAPAVESWYDAGVRLKAEEPPLPTTIEAGAAEEVVDANIDVANYDGVVVSIVQAPAGFVWGGVY